MPKTQSLPNDPDFVGADKALRRAAKVALALARKTKTPCYVMRDGRIVDIAKRQSRVVPKKLVPAK